MTCKELLTAFYHIDPDAVVPVIGKLEFETFTPQRSNQNDHQLFRSKIANSQEKHDY